MSWRSRLLPASFKGVPFHVEDDSVESGRRVVTHEYPMRDEPASEDLGRRARRITVRGYVIGPNFDVRLRALRAACESGGPGPLLLPSQGVHQVRCDFVGTATNREEGGFGTADLEFVEAGSSPGPSARVTAAASLSSASSGAYQAAAATGNR